MNNKHLWAIVIIIALVLLRIPALYLWNDYMTGHDASIYMEKAISLSEGNGFVSSVCRHMNDKEDLVRYIDKFGNNKQEVKVGPLYIYVISVLYTIFGRSNFMLAINLFNLLSFILALVLIYRFNEHYFPNNKLVQLGTLILVGVNFMMIELSYGAHMESFLLLVFTLTFVYHIWFLKIGNNYWLHWLLYPILLSMLFLIKFSNVPLVAAFVLHLLLLKKYKQFMVISIIVFIIAGSWFILRDFLMGGQVIYPFSNSFPFKNGLEESASIIALFIFRSTEFIARLIRIIADFNGLAYFMPFVAIALIKFKTSYIKQISLLLLVTTIVFYYLMYLNVGGPFNPRYIYPIFVFMFPLALAELEKFLINLKYMHKYAIIAILISAFVLVHVIDTFRFANRVRHHSPDRASLFMAADELLEKHNVAQSETVLMNIIGYNVYSDKGIVWTPTNINKENKFEVIDTYKIDYVLFTDNQRHDLSFWDQNLVPVNIFYDLELVEVSEIDNRVKLYKSP